MDDTFKWTDTEEIGLRLSEQFPDRDPLSVRFTELRGLVESLPGFAPEPGHNVNEQILEAIQVAWHEEAEDAKSGAGDDDGPGYSPPTPYRPD